MADQLSGRPSYDENGKLILPDLTELGISKAMLEAMDHRPTTLDAHFCLTGTFAMGDRSDVAQEIEHFGGIIVSKVRKSGCTVVLGTAASEGWAGGAWGRKLEDAAECIREGRPVTIISEDRLAEALLHAVAPDIETPAAARARYNRLLASGDLTKEEAELLRERFGMPRQLLTLL